MTAVGCVTSTHQLSRDGAANLNDMKDMLVNLPQYQEQREKVPAADKKCTVMS